KGLGGHIAAEDRAVESRRGKTDSIHADAFAQLPILKWRLDPQAQVAGLFFQGHDLAHCFDDSGEHSPPSTRPAPTPHPVRPPTSGTGGRYVPPTAGGSERRGPPPRRANAGKNRGRLAGVARRGRNSRNTIPRPQSTADARRPRPRYAPPRADRGGCRRAGA